MYRQRYSCDRCRQQKVRCLKNWESSTAIGSYSDHVTPCERCTKADVPCVYSFRQGSRRKSQSISVASPQGSTRLSQDFSSMLSSSDVTGYGLGDLTLPTLDGAMSSITNGDTYGWNDSPELMYNRTGDNRTQASSGSNSLGGNPTPSQDEGENETLAEQLIKLSSEATSATRELECTIATTPLTVNSAVVNDAFKAANSLVHIINDITQAGGTCSSSEGLSGNGGGRQRAAKDSSIFLILACHQHILALFDAVCNCIKSSLGRTQGTRPQFQPQTLHDIGSSPAQFIMVLQLIMHLLNRLGRSLRMGSLKGSEQDMAVVALDDSGESDTAESLLDSAQVMLKGLPNEHVRLIGVIQDLQAYIEEGLYA